MECYCQHESGAAVIQLQFLINEVRTRGGSTAVGLGKNGSEKIIILPFVSNFGKSDVRFQLLFFCFVLCSPFKAQSVLLKATR